MALKSTICKAALQIADMERNYFGDHVLTIARHPSETDERMMVRVLAFALHAAPDLAFGKGLSDDEEPDLWLKDLTGAIRLWIDIGQPDEKRMRRACGRADQVFVYAYGGQGTELWWKKTAADIERCENLTVTQLPYEACKTLAKLADRNMQLNCTVQEGQLWLANAAESVLVEPVVLKAATKEPR
jgi:uncharacterized protein YaeQ